MSEFDTINFWLQVGSTILGVFLSIYLFLKQQEKELGKKYDDINQQYKDNLQWLKDISTSLTEAKGHISTLSKSSDNLLTEISLLQKELR